MDFIQFFRGPDGNLSSWRLVGILSGFLVLICIWKTFSYLIAVNNSEHLLRLLDSLMFFTITCLGGGLTQHFIIKKNDKNLANINSDQFHNGPVLSNHVPSKND